MGEFKDKYLIRPCKKKFPKKKNRILEFWIKKPDTNFGHEWSSYKKIKFNKPKAKNRENLAIFYKSYPPTTPMEKESPSALRALASINLRCVLNANIPIFPVALCRRHVRDTVFASSLVSISQNLQKGPKLAKMSSTWLSEAIF